MTSFRPSLKPARAARWALGLLSLGIATLMAQAPPAPAPPTPAKPLVFDIVSIRQNMSTQRNGPPKFGPTADGYHMTGAPLLLPIISAYIPQSGGTVAFMPNQIKGLPDWVMRDGYDLDAKAAEEDMPEWQKPATQTT